MKQQVTKLRVLTENILLKIHLESSGDLTAAVSADSGDCCTAVGDVMVGGNGGGGGLLGSRLNRFGLRKRGILNLLKTVGCVEYRVTIHLVQNLPVDFKTKVPFWPGLP